MSNQKVASRHISQDALILSSNSAVWSKYMVMLTCLCLLPKPEPVDFTV